MSMPSILQHKSGANVDNPRPKYTVQLAFVDGEWSLWSVVVGEYGAARPDRKLAVLTHEEARWLTSKTGGYSADVVASNYAMWTEAAEAWAREDTRRARQRAEEALLKAQQRARAVRKLVRR